MNILRILLISAAFFGVSPLVAHANECIVPICDISKSLNEYRNLSMNGRYQATVRLLKESDDYNDSRSLKNLLEFAGALEKLFAELGDEGWVIREASKLKNLVLQKLVKSPGLSIDEAIFYFRQVEAADVRLGAINNWRAKIKEAGSKPELLELARFFAFALEDSQNQPSYVKGAATAAVDETHEKLLTQFANNAADARQYLSKISVDDTLSNVLVALTKKAEADSAGLEELVGLSQVFTAAEALAANRPDFIKLRVSIGATAVNLKLVLSKQVPYEKKLEYFSLISGVDSRRRALEELSKLAADASSKSELLKLRDFFKAAARASEKFDAWLPNMALNFADSATQKLILSLETPADELPDTFKSIRSDQVFSDIFETLTKRAAQLPETDAVLPKLVELFEAGIAQTGGRAEWVRARGSAGLDQISIKLSTAAHSTVEEKMLYFSKIKSVDNRRLVLESIIETAKKLQDKQALAKLNSFFIFAAKDSASYEAWLAGIARRGADIISERLFLEFELTWSEAREYFHQIASDQARRDVVVAWRKRYENEKRRDVLENYNQFFLFATRDSASAASWVREASIAASDELARILLTEHQLTSGEARALFRQIQGDQTTFNILAILYKQAERNRDSYEKLRYLNTIFNAGVLEIRNDPQGPLWRAVAGLDYVNSRMIKKSVIDANEMIELFKVVRSESVRSEIVAYWRGKIRRSYNDKASLLGLARFFHAAEVDSIEKREGDWISAAARFAQQEVTAKLALFAPVFEGVYEVTATCNRKACEGAEFIDRLVLINSQTSDGWMAVLMHGETGNNAFAFPNLEISRGGSAFDGMLNAFGLLSKIHLDYDASTRQITGWIRNSDRSGVITLAGIQRKSSVEAYDRQAARLKTQSLSPPEKIGDFKMRGTFGDKQGTLYVRTLTQGDTRLITGVLVFDLMPQHRIPYQVGHYNPKNGILTLVGTRDSGARLKMVLGLHAHPSGTKLEAMGVGFSSQNQAIHDIYFSE